MKLFSNLQTSFKPIYIQVIFTICVFAAMVFLSYFYMRGIVHTNLVHNAESVFRFAQTQLEADLLEPRLMLSGFSQTVRSMLMRGDSAEDVKAYIDDIANYFHASGSRIMNSTVLFGQFEAFGGESVFISNGVFKEDYFPPGRPWFKLAESNCGYIVETSPYDSILSGNKVITFSRCVHDDNDERLAIIGVEINIDNVGMNVMRIAAENNGYGILISQDYRIITHANPYYEDMAIIDLDIPLSAFIEDFMAGNDIVERRLVNWKGESTVAFFRKLANGWYLGILTPEVPFYQSLTNVASILSVLGCIFAFALIMILIRIDSARNKSDRESKHKSAFLANMSHEIRTPMNAIIGMTTIGKSTNDIGRKDHCFSKIENASNHLLGVINDILDMSKIEANKFELSPAEFNFEKMLQRVVNVVNFRVDEKKQKFTVHIDQSIPKTLIGDDQRIAQVVTNLLGNAIKFTPEGGSISLDARYINEENGMCNIQFSVSDTGIGISPSEQTRIFSSFEQAETSTTRKYGGTGLGLAISKSVVELMNGRIWMLSEIHKGSVFTFIIPLKRGDKEYSGMLSPDVNINNVRIMVVDDDNDILEYFKEIANEFKISCSTAKSGKEAIELVEKNGLYHIYFVDWKMPGMDGIQLTSELKAHKETANSIVIMITAAEWTTVEQEARVAGVDKFLSKPLFPSHIADLLNEVLGISGKKDVVENIDIKGLFTGRQVLLVEDVDINRDIVIELLRPTNITIDCAENGKEAVRMFMETPEKYELILMDVQMPEMDGYEATRRIRALKIQEAQTVRIIAMTANVFREDIERCLEAGMDNHLGKPLDFLDVIDKLRHYLPKNNDK
ncbi:MAG: response regulator [Treponema sp.]|nr:response regulator [Treponema sp.]MCL2251894.1 response regulator [Treponema sp.]